MRTRRTTRRTARGDGRPAGPVPADQDWTTMVRTATMVRALTALADRYDTAIRAGDLAVEGNRERVELMRATADAGRRLLRSRAPAALPVRDGQAPSGAADGLVARLDQRAVLGRAQGVLMERAGLDAGEAFAALLLAADGPLTLDAVAAHVLRTGRLPAGADPG